MFLGGLATVEPIQERPGQVHSDDFVGCVQSVSVNGRTLNLSNPLQTRGVTSTCHRRREICDMHSAFCGEGGSCIDNWSNATCVCQGGLSAPNCFAALEPVSLTDGGYVEFRVSERHRRRQVLRTLYSSTSSFGGIDQRWKREVNARYNRDRRDIGSSSPRNSVSISFRTSSKYGYLFFCSTNNDFTALRVSVRLVIEKKASA